MITRRNVLLGILAAPIVVRSGLLMPVRPIEHPVYWLRWDYPSGKMTHSEGVTFLPNGSIHFGPIPAAHNPVTPAQYALAS